jgi:hypothetical protein
MSERGVFAVDRGIWEHDVLVDDNPFSRREAWLWLLSEAAWKPHRRRLAGRPVELNRGQLAASLRFMASKWRWAEPRVRRFLKTLEIEGMIDATTGAGITLITICKYDKYQRVSLPNDATVGSKSDAPPTQQRRKVEDIEYKEDSIAAAPDEAGGVGVGIALERDDLPTTLAPLPRILISEEAFALSRRVIDAIGSTAVGNTVEVGAPAHCQKWINEGWKPEFCLIVVRQVMSRRGPDNPLSTLKFFDKAIAQYHAEMYRPLPKSNFKPQEIIDGTGRKNTGSHSHSSGGSRGASIVSGLRLAHEVLGIDLRGEMGIEIDPALGGRHEADG